MRKTGSLLLALALFAVLLAGCAGGKTLEKPHKPEPAEGSAPATGQEPSTTGQEEPAGLQFEGTDLEGNTVTADVFAQSKLTMVNVWATYCNPCLREMPGLGRLAAEYDAGEFQIIGIVSDVPEGGDQTLAQSLVEKTGAGYPHLLLNQSLYNALLTDVTAVPTTFFVDGEGNILEVVIGAMDKADWEEKINGLLEDR